MRRILKLSLTCLAAGVVTACDPDTVITTEAIPTAGVRFINAVPDTSAMDFRFVDLVESNPHWGISFRNNIVISPTGANGVPASTLIQYKGARAGARQFKIFMNGGCAENSCDQDFASTTVVPATIDGDVTVTQDATTGTFSVTLVEGVNYTALLWGYANPGRMDTTITNTNTPTPDTAITQPAGLPVGAPALRLTFMSEDVPDPGTNVAIRMINATASPITATYYADGGTAPGTAFTPNPIPALSISDYATTAPDIYWVRVVPGGGGTALFADRRALRGADAVTEAPGPFDAQPGTEVAGSAVTGIVFPRSVGSSPAPSFTTPAISFMWDRRPPRPDGV